MRESMKLVWSNEHKPLYKVELERIELLPELLSNIIRKENEKSRMP